MDYQLKKIPQDLLVGKSEEHFTINDRWANSLYHLGGTISRQVVLEYHKKVVVGSKTLGCTRPSPVLPAGAGSDFPQ